MNTLFFIAALICFGLSAAGTSVAKINLMALGLVFLTLMLGPIA